MRTRPGKSDSSDPFESRRTSFAKPFPGSVVGAMGELVGKPVDEG